MYWISLDITHEVSGVHSHSPSFLEVVGDSPLERSPPEKRRSRRKESGGGGGCQLGGLGLLFIGGTGFKSFKIPKTAWKQATETCGNCFIVDIADTGIATFEVVLDSRPGGFFPSTSK